MSLALRLTSSPRTEYSLLDPEVPTTPAKTVPVAIPILTGQASFFNSFTRRKAVRMALAASS